MDLQVWVALVGILRPKPKYRPAILTISNVEKPLLEKELGFRF